MQITFLMMESTAAAVSAAVHRFCGIIKSGAVADAQQFTVKVLFSHLLSSANV